MDFEILSDTEPIVTDKAAIGSDSEVGDVAESDVPDVMSLNGDEENEDLEEDVIPAEADDGDDTGAVDADPHSAPARPRSKANPSPLDLPQAVVRRLMKSSAPSKRFTPELIAAVSRAAGTFGLYLLSASQESGHEAGKSTLRPVDVLEGLLKCGFPELAEEARIGLGLNESVFRQPKKKKQSKPRK